MFSFDAAVVINHVLVLLMVCLLPVVDMCIACRCSWCCLIVLMVLFVLLVLSVLMVVLSNDVLLSVVC